jgi:hypothetical protein
MQAPIDTSNASGDLHFTGLNLLKNIGFISRIDEVQSIGGLARIHRKSADKTAE